MNAAFVQHPLSPPGASNAPYATTTGKHPRMEIVSNRKKDLASFMVKKKDLRLPTRATPDAAFVQETLGSTPYMIGKGQYGTVFYVDTLTQGVRSKMQRMYGALTNRITLMEPDAMHLNSSLIIKVVSLHSVLEHKNWAAIKSPKDRTALWDNVLENGLYEAVIHAAIVRATPLPVRCPGGALLVRPSDVVPMFYASGTDCEHGVHITIMSVVKGGILERFIPRKQPNTPANLQKPSRALVVASVEKALLTLAVAGVEHGDAHGGNILVLPDGRVKVIDFGLAMVVPEVQQAVAQDLLEECLNIFFRTGTWPEAVSNAVFYGINGTGTQSTSIARYANSYMDSFKFFYFGGKALRYYKTRIAKPVLDAARRAVWTCGIAPREPSSPARKRAPPTPNTTNGKSRARTNSAGSSPRGTLKSRSVSPQQSRASPPAKRRRRT